MSLWRFLFPTNTSSFFPSVGFVAASVILQGPNALDDPYRISLDNLPQGRLIASSQSPDELCTLKAYLCSGDLTADAVRVSLTEGSKTKNIFWKYRCTVGSMNWLNNQTVDINGHVLNVRHDTYDWRVDAE